MNRRMKMVEKHQEFWSKNNEKFTREKEEFSRMLGSHSATGTSKTTRNGVELSRFYKEYLGNQREIMKQFNRELWMDNWRNVFLDLRYEAIVLLHFLRYNMNLGSNPLLASLSSPKDVLVRNWVWIWFGLGLLTPIFLQ